MEIRIKNAAGAVMLLTALPSIAQESVSKLSPSTGCASCPPNAAITAPPGDPTWFIAGLVTGLVLGFVAGKVLGAKKQQ